MSSLQPSFLQAKELLLPQLLLIRFDLANKYYSYCLQLGCQQVIIINMNTFRTGSNIYISFFNPPFSNTTFLKNNCWAFPPLSCWKMRNDGLSKIYITLLSSLWRRWIQMHCPCERTSPQTSCSPSLLGHWVTSQAEWTGPPVTRSLLPVCHTAVHGWQLEACKEVSGALLWLGRWAVQWVNPGFSWCFWNLCHDCGFQGKTFFRGTLTPGQMRLYPREVSFGFLSLVLFQKLSGSFASTKPNAISIFILH